MLRRLLSTAIVCLAISIGVLALSGRPSTAQDAAPVIDNPPAADTPVKDKATRQQPAPDLRDKATIREAAKAMGTAMRLAKAGPSAKTDRAALAQQISQKYLTDAKAAKALTAPQWNTVYRSLQDVVSLEKWGPVIWEAYGDDEKASALLTVYDAKMSEAATRAILPHMPLPKIVAMMGQMKKAGKDAAATRQIALDHLAQRVTDVEAIKKIKTSGFASVVATLQPTKPDVAATAAVAWLRGSQAWKDEPVGLCTIIKTLGPAKDEDKQPLAEAVQSAFDDEDVPWRSCADMAEAWGVVKVKSAAAHWAHRCYDAALGSEKARASATITTIVTAAEALEYGGVFGNKIPHPEVAQVVARLAREGKLADSEWRYSLLPGVLLGSVEDIDAVKQELCDDQGHLRLPVAKILTWAYRHQWNESLSEWRSYAKQQADSGEKTPEEKMQWMIVTLLADRAGEQRPPKIKAQWVLDALKSSEVSQELKLACLRQLIDYYNAIDRYDLAIPQLDEGVAILQEDSDEDVAKQFAPLRETLLKHKEGYRLFSIKQAQLVVAQMQEQVDKAKTPERREFFARWLERNQATLDALVKDAPASQPTQGGAQ